MSTILLEVATPDKGEVYAKDINMLIVRSTAGELGILPRHANLLTELLPHAMRSVYKKLMTLLSAKVTK